MSSPLHEAIESFKPAGDIISFGVAFATLISWLPNLAALLTILWTMIRIYETQTVQGWLGRKPGA